MISLNSYGIPFTKSIKRLAISDLRVHLPPYQHSVDFILPIGTDILSAFDGVVIEKQMTSKVGGVDKKLKEIKYVNYMVIKHVNEEYSLYGHLQYRSSSLSIGDNVSKGLKIAKSGLSGLMNVPHVHFHVYKIDNQGEDYSIPIRFDSRVQIYYPNRESNSLYKLLKSYNM